MNKRTADLFAQALDEAVPETWTRLDMDQVKRLCDKFAELIVQECMEVVINGQYSASECHGNSHRISYNNGRTGASSDIKKHFGVEE